MSSSDPRTIDKSAAAGLAFDEPFFAQAVHDLRRRRIDQPFALTQLLVKLPNRRHAELPQLGEDVVLEVIGR